MEENTDFENNDLIPHLKTLTTVTNKMVLQGYDDDFKIVDNGLKSLKTEKNISARGSKRGEFF